MRICGLAEDQIVELIQVVPLRTIKGLDNQSDTLVSVKVVYKLEAQNYDDRIVFRRDEDRLCEAQDSWAYGENAELARLAWEARRCRFAHLFDPYNAIFTSDIEPFPHQIEAVYLNMLGRHPLRFLLADDPGAGKTIMAGLLVREMMARDVVRRCLIVVPGNLSEQWRTELRQKFRLSFEVLSREMIQGENPFAERNRLIARMDQLKRSEYRELLGYSKWDLIICDEAHKMSATYSGGEISRTQRYLLGEDLSGITRHFLLMTATPHNGNEPDWRLFLRLLDEDRFEGRFRAGVQQVDTSDIVLRRMKEQLVTLEGTPLFPERKAYTANYDLSDQERALYEEVTAYCRNEFNRADRLEGGRRNTVGFALTVLQRRLASSPEAIYQSLKSRRQRLEQRLLESQEIVFETFNEAYWEDFDDLPDDEREKKENEISDLATTAQSIAELESEIATLCKLETQANEVRRSNTDSKWEKLREIWERRLPEMEMDGQLRKLIIFTEHRATLSYLVKKLGILLGNPRAVVTIHGRIRQEQRHEIQDRFRSDPQVQILVATDAAGEGINLQFAHLMVNYDLPWNPNRLEQRFGRIHRIGQTEVCHLWNVVTKETREGSVYERLLQKLETIGNALNGKVFDVLGELFEGEPLPQLLKQALRYGDDPRVRERLNRAIDNAVNTERIHELAQGRVLASDIIDVDRLLANMEVEGVGRWTTRDTRDFLLRVFDSLSFDYSSRAGAEIRELEDGCYEIVQVPGVITEYAQHNDISDVRSAYSRVCFEPVPLRLATGFNAPEFIGPGHPLIEATISWVIAHWEKHSPECGEELPVLVDENDNGSVYRVLFYLEWAIHNAIQEDSLIERKAHFVQIDCAGNVSEADAGDHLSFRAVEAKYEAQVVALLGEDWLQDQTFEDHTVAYGNEHLVQPHREEIENREVRQREREIQQVQASLQEEIDHEQSLIDQYSRQARQRPENAAAYSGLRAQAQDRKRKLQDRLDRRMSQFTLHTRINPSSIIVRRVAIIVPAGLLRL